MDTNINMSTTIVGGGTATSNQVTVDGTHGNLTIDGNFGPIDVTVGNGPVQGIRGNVTLLKGMGATLTMDDSANTKETSNTYTLSKADKTPDGLVNTSSMPATIAYKYAGTSSVTIKTGMNNPVVDVLATGVPTSLLTNDDTNINVGGHGMGGTLQSILGPLTIDKNPAATGPLANMLVVDDSNSSIARTVNLDSFTDSGSQMFGSITVPLRLPGGTSALAAINYLATITTSLDLYSGVSTRGNRVNVLSTVTSFTLHSGSPDRVFVGSAIRPADSTLDTILQASITIRGQNDALQLNDVNSSGPHRYSLSGVVFRFSRDNIRLLSGDGIASVAFNAGADANEIIVGNLEPNLTVTANGGASDDTFVVLTRSPNQRDLTLHGLGGTNTLRGPNQDNTWSIRSSTSGKITPDSGGAVLFSDMANLIGGSGIDSFVLDDGAGVTGSIDGGGGGDWLDYTAYSTGVTVNLATNSARGVPNGITGIQNVRGGDSGDRFFGNAQGNILVGGKGMDRLVGGSGPNLLIGGGSADFLFAGTAGDILIGGRTKWDPFNQPLRAILTKWQSGLGYGQRIADLRTGVPFNGGTATLVLGQTVVDDHVNNKLRGGPAMDWFLLGQLDALANPDVPMLEEKQ